MSKKILMVAVLSGLVGFVAGNAFWYLASPLWIDNVVSEGFSAQNGTQALAKGAFKGADGVHAGTGTATVYREGDERRIVRFTDFEVTNGPDLKVWLVAHPNVTDADHVTASPYVGLGRLKGNIGDQNYEIPSDVDLSKYRSVVIWCEQFSVLFATAVLAE